MSDEFKPGDVVRPKSGGPKMVVASVEDRYGTMSVFCEFFNEKTGKQDSAVFALTSMEKC